MNLTTTFFLAFLCFSSAVAQFSNPFDKHRKEYNSIDFITVVSDPNDSSMQQILGYDWIKGLQPGKSWTKITPVSNRVGFAATSNGYIVCKTGHFNDNEKSDVFYLTDKNSQWQYGVSEQNTSLRSDSLWQFGLPRPNFIASGPISSSRAYPVVVVGDYDGNGLDEVAVVWGDQNNLIYVQFIKFSMSGGKLVPSLAGSIAQKETSLRLNNFHGYSATAADLNGDKKDELIISGFENNSKDPNVQYNAFFNVFESSQDGNFTLSSKVRRVYDSTSLLKTYPGKSGSNIGYIRTGLQGVRSYKALKDSGELSLFAAMAFSWNNIGSGGIQYDYLNTCHAKFNNTLSLSSLTTGPKATASDQHFMQQHPFEIHKGDLNRDGVDEIVVMDRVFSTFSFDSTGKLIYHFNTGDNYFGNTDDALAENIQQTTNMFEVGDIDRDGYEDIICQSKQYDGNQTHTIYMDVFNLDTKMSLVKRGSYSYKVNSGNSKVPYAFSTGNLDGTDLKLGEPLVYTCEYHRPTMILGCVPYHFDVLDGKILDVNNCGISANCGNEVVMLDESANDSTLSVAMSNSVTGSFTSNLDLKIDGSGLGITRSESKTVEWRHDFDKSYKIRKSYTERTFGDDRVIGYVHPIRFYEYPVLTASGKDTVSWILAVVLDYNNSKTISARGYGLLNYLPNYEIGNVLSYPKYNDPDMFYDSLPNKKAVIWNAGSLNLSTTAEVSKEYSKEVSTKLANAYSEKGTGTLEVEATFGGFGIGGHTIGGGGIGQKIEYNYDGLHVFSQALSKVQSFQINSKRLATNYDQFEYTIRPYLYKTKGNGLKMSMAVDMDPLVNTNMGEWVNNYGQKPDPSLNMPWRLDSFKTTSYIPANKDRTRSIYFKILNPNPGDTAEAYIRIFNYSLKDMNEKTEFRLYNGHPDKGGIPIMDLNGNTLFTTNKNIEKQGRDVVKVSFVVTNEMVAGSDNRIYVKLDPDNKIDEIHEENNLGYCNIGFNCNLNPNSGTLTIREVDAINDKLIFSAYPNPADNLFSIGISNSLAGTEKDVHLEIYSLNGLLIEKIDVGERTFNTYSFDIRSLNSGLYIYKILNKGQFLKSGKLVVRK
ncbi:MAG: T9SS type A sorting domain-containing protein [Flavobacteriales bacterium]|nr:T9SS type A sorting domain-containing protein [Flavobacteriales bacterium]